MTDKITYRDFGVKLQEYRERFGIGLKKAARELKIDFSYLSKLEKGMERPSKDLLGRLVFTYRLSRDEAVELFNLVGYREGVVAMNGENKPKAQSGHEMTIPSETKTLYADVVNVTASPHGFVLNFAQQLGPTNRFVVVSRIGMSREHVKSLIRVLSGLLAKPSGKKGTRKVVIH